VPEASTAVSTDLPGGFVSLGGLGITWWAMGVGMAVWARETADSTLDPEDIVVL